MSAKETFDKLLDQQKAYRKINKNTSGIEDWVSQMTDYHENQKRIEMAKEERKKKSKDKKIMEMVIDLFEELDDDDVSYNFRNKLKELKAITGYYD